METALEAALRRQGELETELAGILAAASETILRQARVILSLEDQLAGGQDSGLRAPGGQ